MSKHLDGKKDVQIFTDDVNDALNAAEELLVRLDEAVEDI